MTNIRDLEPQPLLIPLSADGSEVLAVDVGAGSGWAAYHAPGISEAQIHVLLRLGPTDASEGAPLQIKEVHVAGATEGVLLDSPLFRTIPFARISAAVNQPAIADALRPLVAPSFTVMTNNLGSGYGAWLLPPEKPIKPSKPRLKLKIPAGQKRPDSFYASVASVYLAQATLSPRPAVDLAEANGVPTSTVHRWLKEARARGLLRLPGLGPGARGEQS